MILDLPNDQFEYRKNTSNDILGLQRENHRKKEIMVDLDDGHCGRYLRAVRLEGSWQGEYMDSTKKVDTVDCRGLRLLSPALPECVALPNYYY